MADRTHGVVLLDVLGDDGAFDASMLERLGHEVVTCPGPPDGTLCPLRCNLGCDRFERAHGVVFELDLDRPQHRAILQRYRDLGRDDLPIAVIAHPEQQGRYVVLLRQLDVWDHEPSSADLDGFVARVEAADRTG